MKKLLLFSTAVITLTIAHGQGINPNVTTTMNPCPGQCVGTATSNPTGGTPPYTYLWTPGNQTTQTITGLCNGMYAVQVMDITGPPAVVQAFSISSSTPAMQVNWSITNASCQTCCDGIATANISGGQPNYTYQWCNGAITQTISGLCVGCCYFSVTDANGCTKIDSACVGFTTGQTEINSSTGFSTYPNPFSTQTTLQTIVPLNNATLTVDNCFGQTVAQIKNISGQSIVFNRDNLSSGLYFVRLTADNKIYTDKFIITNK